MAIGNIGWMQLLIILLIVLLIFGTKRIRNIGSDLGGAIREFRKGVGDNDGDEDSSGDGKPKSKGKSAKRSEEQGDESASSREH